MSPEAIDAQALSQGWRVVAVVPSDPADLTMEHADAFFCGDRSALRDIARLATHPAAGATTPYGAVDNSRDQQPHPSRPAA